MSTHYTTEPPPTASVLLHTSAGPITLSLFSTQTPLTCRNFLQLCLDGYYDGCLFHRVAPGFVIQTGDPTGTGEGGENIYEQREFERYDREWAKVMGREEGEKIKFGDEVHSRLKFNRRGLVGMAKGTGKEGDYGSQFFVTLGDCRAELDGRCTMFGRVEGEGIYNVVRIAEGELGEGTERPVFPERVLRAEVLQMPSGAAWEGMKRREKVSREIAEVKAPPKKKAVKKKTTKTILSFGEEEGDEGAEEMVVKLKKAKFNTALIDDEEAVETKPTSNGHKTTEANSRPPARRKGGTPSPGQKADVKHSSPEPKPPETSTTTHRRKPSFHDSTTQLPIRDPESPSRSATPDTPLPRHAPSTASLSDEIAALKASMRRDVGPAPTNKHTKSALEAMIPATSTRGRKRPRPGESSSKEDKSALAILNAFKARLDSAQEKERADVDMADAPLQPQNGRPKPTAKEDEDDNDDDDEEEEEEEEAKLCDLHFIANCQSCSRWDAAANDGDRKHDENDADDDADGDANDGAWMSHALSFGKDQLGKDLGFKRRQAALEELVVIDPREKEGRILAAEREQRRRDKERAKMKMR